LLASLLGALSAPMSKLTGVLRVTMGRLVGTLNSLNNVKQ